MAKLNGLKALFSSQSIQRFMDQKAEEFDEKALKTLQFKGEQFVNAARMTDTYTDRTGNLRSSIGYIILKDGQIVDRNFTGKSSEGVSKAEKFALELSAKYSNGYVLIGVAGMHYAAYVEARGYDVITGSAPDEGEFRKLLDAIKF